ncbi:unnamed protein product [Durusdinium trenchii]|uniref:Uncharacterized protein n=1 Tax=Durusdinium trenchii TaxID=1381693 RepID=A0ABP0QZG5_9DINO
MELQLVPWSQWGSPLPSTTRHPPSHTRRTSRPLERPTRLARAGLVGLILAGGTRKSEQTRQRQRGRIPCWAYSATSFATYLRSDFAAWMDRLKKECPDHPWCLKETQGGLAEVFIKQGLVVEERLLQWFRTAHPEWRILDLSTWTDDLHRKEPNWREIASNHTLEVLEHGEVDVIYQAPLYHDKLELFGIADFLLRRGKEYVIWDTKLSKHPQGAYLAQLACYAEILCFLMSLEPEAVTVGLVLGENAEHGTAVELPFSQIRDHFLSAWSAFGRFQQRWTPPQSTADGRTRPGVPVSVVSGRWEELSKHLLSEEDDLLLVAGMKSSQRRKLRQLGISTLEQLAQWPSRKLETLHECTGMRLSTVEMLQRQAKLQYRSRSTIRPASEVLPSVAKTLAKLPEDDGGDLFLDLEGMALFKDPYFLNYLIGISLRDGSYLEWWSHRLEDEAQSFQKVLDYVFNRRKEYPDMHVYCYGHYEAGAFRRTARRLSDEYQAMTEEFLEKLLVDLLPVVKGSIALGLPGYGLKNVEKMYQKPRSTDVSIAVDSMVAYAKWTEEREHGHPHPELLRHIAEYNRADCESTLHLLTWLRKRCAKAAAKVHATPPKQPNEVRKKGRCFKGQDLPLCGRSRNAASCASKAGKAAKAPKTKTLVKATDEMGKALEDFQKLVDERCAQDRCAERSSHTFPTEMSVACK